MKKHYFIYLLLITIIAILTLLKPRLIQDLTINPFYIILIALPTLLFFITVLFKLKTPNQAYPFLFAPIVTIPIFRCYFKLPYIFCHQCPNKCIFGLLRPYLTPSILLINIENKYWCNNSCPISFLQQFKFKTIKLEFLKYLKYIIIPLTILSYFLIKNTTFYNFMFKHLFTFSSFVLITAIFIFILSFFINKFWCNYLCPVGNSSSLILNLFKK